jgi:hypothetical protein
MTYTLRSIQFSPVTGHVLNVDWSFTTSDGELSSTHVLHTPAGDKPAAEVTEAVLIDWLRQQSSQTEAEMAASLKAERARRDATASQITVQLLAGESIAQAATRQREAQEQAQREQERRAALPEWDSTASYATGAEVRHQGVVWRKLDDSDNTEPDDVPGGWVAA